ncbi:DUF917 domain-containing protein [Chroococcus sp. FPU101]|uniref:DUF917 domain-containing protein n=1 Tax=Chroococcus sp. FPU101 TaxID=1974212 RepID=UPI001A8DF43A|nr:DUF917 domain-containing protein [Chroococcus sp. FPU101]GFE70238.1 hypothetical protein CFPU101_28480 [Chroococcus sp. FPU101]
MQKLGAEELTDLINGAAFFGSGGGGSLQLALKYVELLKQFPPIELIDIQEVNDQEWGAVVAAVGAPPSSTDEFAMSSQNSLALGVHNTVLLNPAALNYLESCLESQPLSNNSSLDVSELVRLLSKPFELLEKALNLKNNKFSFSLAIETGAGNVLVAILVAAIKKIRLINGCGAGRSVPQLNMTTYAFSDISPEPAVLISTSSLQTSTAMNRFDGKEIEMLLNSYEVKAFEQLVRKIVSLEEFNNYGLLATYAMTGQTLKTKKPIIPGTLSKAQSLGSILRKAKMQGRDPVEAALDFLNANSDTSKQKSAYKIFQGIITKILPKKVQSGFMEGIVILEKDNIQVRILYKNENLIAWQSNKLEPLVMGPDLICYLTPKGVPLTNADIQEGDELVLIGIKAPKEIQNEQIRQIFHELAGYYGIHLTIDKLR